MKRNAIASTIAAPIILAAAWYFFVGRSHHQDEEPGAGATTTDVPTEPAVPGTVRVRGIVDELADTTRSWQDRINAAHRLPKNLEADEVKILFEFLKIAPQVGAEKHYLVVNEVMEQLRLGGQAGEAYSVEMASLISDDGVDGVVRDYAIQHASIWLDPDGIHLDEPDAESITPSHRRILLDAITDAVVDPENLTTTIPGTGLTALAELSITLPEELRQRTLNRLRPLLESIVNGTISTQEGNRIAAVDVAARLNIRRVHPQILAMVESGQTSPSLRLACIAALGAFGKKEDEEFLRGLASSGERYSFAASEALRRIDSAQGATAIPMSPIQNPKGKNSKQAESDNESEE